MANISIYDPRTMGKLVERMPKVHTFIKSTFFRNVETFDTQKIDVDFKKGNRQLAPFVHKKIGGDTIDNEGFQTNTYEPPLVAPNKITTVDDILKRTPGESLYNGKTPNQRAIASHAFNSFPFSVIMTSSKSSIGVPSAYFGTSDNSP